MFSGWFKRNKQEITKSSNSSIPENADFSFLGADMHSHFIPSIDDGSSSMEMSLNLIRGMVEMGYNTIITTPHVMIDFYPNTEIIINSGFELLKTAIIENKIDVTIRAAAEYFIDEYFIQKMESTELLCINNKEVLIEFSMLSEPPMLKEVIFKMRTTGYRPIIAHPERYNYLHNNFDNFIDLKDRGCLLQLNILALTGYYGHPARKISEELLEKKMYDYCGTDIHHEKHLAAVKSILNSKVYNLLFDYPFLNKKLCIK